MAKKPNPEHALRELNAKILRMPGSLPLRLERARLLEALGRTAEARKGYEDVLGRDPKNWTALTNLALLLYRSGSPVEAFERYRDAALQHPDNAVAQANLGFMLLKGGDLRGARERYERAVELDPNNQEAARGLAAALAQLGETMAAAAPANPVVTLPYRGNGTPVRVLVPVSLRAGNVRTDRLLDDRLFAVTKLVIEQCGDTVDVPPHDVIFNAIADPDDAPEALARVAALLTSASAPVLNRPDRIAPTGRRENAQRLRSLEGVRAAKVQSFPRDRLVPATLEAHGFAFPVLLRSLGFHSGDHFARVERAEDLAATVATLPGDDLLAIEFIDTRDSAGGYRKYRAMFVGAAIYPLHLAVSHDWKVHYFSSEMESSEAYRAEEVRYLQDAHGVLGDSAYRALQRVQHLLGLDYAGADFTLGPSGELVVFEANATMVVPAPPEGEHFAYRREPIERIVHAFGQMVTQRASRTLL